MPGQVRHGPVVATAKRIAIGVAIFTRNMGVTIRIVIVGIRVMVMLEISASCFNALVEPAPLHIAEFLRGLFPVIVILRSHRGGPSIRCRCVRLHQSRTGNSQRKCKYG